MTALVLTMLMIATFALTAGGVYLLRTGSDIRRGWLMLAAAVVMLGNVLIWTL